MAKKATTRRRVQDAERALAVAYVEIAVAIAGLEHRLEQVQRTIKALAPPAKRAKARR